MYLEMGRYRIRTDPHNVVLEKYFSKRNRKTGEKNAPDWYGLGFYSSLPSALEGMLTHKMKSSEATSAKELLSELGALRDEVLAALPQSDIQSQKATRMRRAVHRTT